MPIITTAIKRQHFTHCRNQFSDTVTFMRLFTVSTTPGYWFILLQTCLNESVKIASSSSSTQLVTGVSNQKMQILTNHLQLNIFHLATKVYLDHYHRPQQTFSISDQGRDLDLYHKPSKTCSISDQGQDLDLYHKPSKTFSISDQGQDLDLYHKPRKTSSTQSPRSRFRPWRKTLAELILLSHQGQASDHYQRPQQNLSYLVTKVKLQTITKDLSRTYPTQSPRSSFRPLPQTSASLVPLNDKSTNLAHYQQSSAKLLQHGDEDQHCDYYG